MGEALICPSCSTSSPEPYWETGDVLTCPACQARFRVVGGDRVVLVRGQAPSLPRMLITLALVTLVILALTAVVVWVL